MTSPAYETGAIQMAPDVYAFVQPGGATNAGFIVERDGVVVIDTLMTRSLAGRLMAAVRSATEAPVKYIINTHWHGDHVFGNAVLPAAPILAHHTCRDDLLLEWDSHRAFLHDLYPESWAEVRDLPAVPPSVTFDRELTLHLESRTIHLRHFGRAHTRGDIAAYLPDDGVLFAGDLAFHDYIPNARDGFPSDWIAAATALDSLDVGLVVPGHGPLGSANDVARMRECLTMIAEQVKRSFGRGLDEAQALSTLQLGPFASWGRQADRLPTLVARFYAELRGDI